MSTKKAFIVEFGSESQLSVFAPGRINLLGEHVDYNGGIVMPAAIQMGIQFEFSINDSTEHKFYALDMEESAHIGVSGYSKVKEPFWVNYLMGVLDQLEKAGHQFPPTNVLFSGTIPSGAGLSSSAALECGFAFGMCRLYGIDIEKKELAQICQRAEHEFAGVNCGIMDQFSSIFGKKDHFFSLDCVDLSFKYLKWPAEHYELLLIDSHVKHSLASSAYNERRMECEQGLKLLNKLYNKDHLVLREYSINELLETEYSFDPIVFRRIKYVIEEIGRVKSAMKLLEENDIAGVADLLYQSHEGLSNLYEVSCEELNFLVDFLKNETDSLGSRMMGGGFGGCTINILKANDSMTWKEELIKRYNSAFGVEPSFYRVELSNGVTINS